MDGAPAKPKGRKRLAKKVEAAPAAPAARAGSVTAAAAPAAARPTATEATATQQTEQDEATQPQPTLSQRLVKSLKQLSQLGGGSKAEVRALRRAAHAPSGTDLRAADEGAPWLCPAAVLRPCYCDHAWRSA